MLQCINYAQMESCFLATEELAYVHGCKKRTGCCGYDGECDEGVRSMESTRGHAQMLVFGLACKGHHPHSGHIEARHACSHDCKDRGAQQQWFVFKSAEPSFSDYGLL